MSKSFIEYLSEDDGKELSYSGDILEFLLTNTFYKNPLRIEKTLEIILSTNVYVKYLNFSFYLLENCLINNRELITLNRAMILTLILIEKIINDVNTEEEKETLLLNEINFYTKIVNKFLIAFSHGDDYDVYNGVIICFVDMLRTIANDTFFQRIFYDMEILYNILNCVQHTKVTVIDIWLCLLIDILTLIKGKNNKICFLITWHSKYHKNIYSLLINIFNKDNITDKGKLSIHIIWKLLNKNKFRKFQEIITMKFNFINYKYNSKEKQIILLIETFCDKEIDKIMFKSRGDCEFSNKKLTTDEYLTNKNYEIKLMNEKMDASDGIYNFLNKVKSSKLQSTLLLINELYFVKRTSDRNYLLTCKKEQLNDVTKPIFPEKVHSSHKHLTFHRDGNCTAVFDQSIAIKNTNR